MADKLKGKPGFAGWRHAVWVFIKAQLSSYVASLIDFLVTILLVKLSGLFYLYATFLGSVVGGVVNCVINYGGISCGRLQKDACCTEVSFCLGR